MLSMNDTCTDALILLILNGVYKFLPSILRQRKLGVTPVFDPDYYPEIAQQLAPESWDQPPRQ